MLILVKQSITRCTEICSDSLIFQCDFRWSFTRHCLVVSDISCYALCWNVSEVNNSIKECLIAFQTHPLSFDQLKFVQSVGMHATLNGRKEQAVAASFSDPGTALLWLRMPRLPSDMPVWLPSCLFLLQSVHSTDFCQSTVGNLNDKLHSSILAVFRSRF